MSRKAVNTTEMVSENNSNNLGEIIESYIYNKKQENHFKSLASSENTQIKSIMEEMNISKFETNSGSAIISERKTETFIEDKLIEFLKSNGVADRIVKTKEYVDFDALESAIYHETIPADVVKEMASCKDVKVTTVLRIK